MERHVNSCYKHNQNFVSMCFHKSCEEMLLCAKCQQEHPESHRAKVVELSKIRLKQDSYYDVQEHASEVRSHIKETRSRISQDCDEIFQSCQQIIQQETRKVKRQYENSLNYCIDEELRDIDRQLKELEEFEESENEKDLQSVGHIINYTHSNKFQEKIYTLTGNRDSSAQADPENTNLKNLVKNQSKNQKHIYNLITAVQVLQSYGLSEALGDEDDPEEQPEDALHEGEMLNEEFQPKQELSEYPEQLTFTKDEEHK